MCSIINCISYKIHIFPSDVIVSLEEPSYTVSEGVDSVMVCAAITSGELTNSEFVNVQLTTMDGSAGEIVLISLTHETQSHELMFLSPPPVSDSDYSPVTSSQLLSSFNTRVCIDIPILIDNLVENDETFIVELSSSSGDVTLVAPMTATVTILDDSSKEIYIQ